MDITYRLAKFEDLEEAERVAQDAGNVARAPRRAAVAGATVSRVSEMLPRGGSRRPLGRGTWRHNRWLRP